MHSSTYRPQSEPKRRRLDRDAQSNGGSENNCEPLLLSSFSIHKVLLFHKRSLEKKVDRFKVVIEEHAALKKECTNLLNRQRYASIIEGEDRLTHALKFKLENVKIKLEKEREKYQRLQKSVQDDERKASRRKYLLNILDITKKLHEDEERLQKVEEERLQKVEEERLQKEEEERLQKEEEAEERRRRWKAEEARLRAKKKELEEARLRAKKEEEERTAARRRAEEKERTAARRRAVGLEADAMSEEGGRRGLNTTSSSYKTAERKKDITLTYRRALERSRNRANDLSYQLPHHHTESRTSTTARSSYYSAVSSTSRAAVVGKNRVNHVMRSSLNEKSDGTDDDDDDDYDINRGELDRLYHCTKVLNGSGDGITESYAMEEETHTVGRTTHSSNTPSSLDTEDRARVNQLLDECVLPPGGTAATAAAVEDDPYGSPFGNFPLSPSLSGTTPSPSNVPVVTPPRRWGTIREEGLPLSQQSSSTKQSSVHEHQHPCLANIPRSLHTSSPSREVGSYRTTSPSSSVNTLIDDTRSTKREGLMMAQGRRRHKSHSEESDSGIMACFGRRLGNDNDDDNDDENNKTFPSSSYSREDVKMHEDSRQGTYSSSFTGVCASSFAPTDSTSTPVQHHDDRGEQRNERENSLRGTNVQAGVPLVEEDIYASCCSSSSSISDASSLKAQEDRAPFMTSSRRKKARRGGNLAYKEFETLPSLGEGRLWGKAQSFYAHAPQTRGSMHLDVEFAHAYEKLKNLERERIELGTDVRGYAYVAVRASEDIIVTQLLAASFKAGTDTTSNFLRVEVYWPADALIQCPDNFTKTFTRICVKVDCETMTLKSGLCDELMLYGGNVKKFLTRVLELAAEEFWR